MSVKAPASSTIGNELSTQNLGQAAKTKQARRSNRAEGPQGQASGSHYDVSLSDRSRQVKADYEKAYAIASSTPPIREDKIKEIKEKIARGEYELDSGKIADAILREAVREELAKSSL